MFDGHRSIVLFAVGFFFFFLCFSFSPLSLLNSAHFPTLVLGNEGTITHTFFVTLILLLFLF